MDRTFAGAETGQAVGHRLAGHLGRLPGRLGQRQAGREPGGERGRVGAAGAVGGGDAVPGDREGQVPRPVEQVVDGIGAVAPGDQGRARPWRPGAR